MLPKENVEYEYRSGNLLIEGLVKGSTVANIVGEVEVIDKTNKLTAFIELDPDERLNSLWGKLSDGMKHISKFFWLGNGVKEKRPSDTVVITIYDESVPEDEKEVDWGHGSYLERVVFGKKTYWENEDPYCIYFNTEDKYFLPSDTSLREDLQLINAETWDEA